MALAAELSMQGFQPAYFAKLLYRYPFLYIATDYSHLVRKQNACDQRLLRLLEFLINLATFPDDDVTLYFVKIQLLMKLSKLQALRAIILPDPSTLSNVLTWRHATT